MTLRNAQGVPVTGIEVWIGYGDFSGQCGEVPFPRAYATPGGDELFCRHPTCGILDWPYHEIAENPATFRPQFGRRQSTGVEMIALQYEVRCGPGYTTVKCVEARSTDFDGDGDTDQLDKIEIGRGIASPDRPSWYNLNTDDALDTTVDGSDYLVVVDEMQRSRAAELCVCPEEAADDEPVCGPSSSFVEDLSAPDATTLGIATAQAGCLTLQWTSPGDDFIDGQRIGVPDSFDLRTSYEPITSANFDQAIPVATPAPGLAGTVHVLTVDPCVVRGRYWAIRTRDHRGNWSPMSNVLLTADPSAPAAIADLGSTCAGRTGVLLSWTSPGDDDDQGTACCFDIRYSLSPITDENFTSATRVARPPAPMAAGSRQEVAVNGLLASRTYHFAMKTTDEGGNRSALSNLFSARLRGSGISTCSAADGPRDGPAEAPPALVALSVPRPNPARSSSRLDYSVPPESEGIPFDLSVYDVLGRRVRTLAHGPARSGHFSIEWDHRSDGGAAAGPGVFFMRLNLGGRDFTRTILVTPW